MEKTNLVTLIQRENPLIIKIEGKSEKNEKIIFNNFIFGEMNEKVAFRKKKIIFSPILLYICIFLIKNIYIILFTFNFFFSILE